MVSNDPGTVRLVAKPRSGVVDVYKNLVEPYRRCEALVLLRS